MSGLELAAAVIGITDVAVKGLTDLYHFLQDIRGADKTINGIRTDLEAIQRCLEQIADIASGNAETKTDLEKLGLQDAVNRCGSECTAFRAKLVEWLHDDKVLNSWRKLVVTMHSHSIETMAERVNKTFNHVSIVLQVAVLKSLVRVGAITKEEQTAATRAEVAKISSQIVVVEAEQGKLGVQEDELQQSLMPAGASSASESRDNDRTQLAEIQIRKQILKDFLAACVAATSQLEAPVTKATQKLGAVTTDDGGHSQVGMSGELVDKVDKQVIGCVKTGKNATARVGMW